MASLRGQGARRPEADSDNDLLTPSRWIEVSHNRKRRRSFPGYQAPWDYERMSVA